MLPAAAEIYRKIVAADGLGHPSETCLPKTFPNQILLPLPIQIGLMEADMPRPINSTIERWERRDVGHLRLRLTIEDVGAYQQPWTAEVQFTLVPDTTLLEFVCENEKFASRRR
jgi:hypothetical protein